jgi:hypothetical protein
MRLVLVMRERESQINRSTFEVFYGVRQARLVWFYQGPFDLILLFLFQEIFFERSEEVKRHR